MRGHIHKRVRNNAAGKETTRWYVVVDTGVDETGRRRQKWHGGFDTRRAAEVERAKIVNDLHTGGYVAPDRLTVAAWAPLVDQKLRSPVVVFYGFPAVATSAARSSSPPTGAEAVRPRNAR